MTVCESNVFVLTCRLQSHVSVIFMSGTEHNQPDLTAFEQRFVDQFFETMMHRFYFSSQNIFLMQNMLSFFSIRSFNFFLHEFLP